MRKTHNGSCHCGLMKFQVTADIVRCRVCDCSVCIRRGALIFRVPEQDLHLETPLQAMTVYEWGSRTAKDYFCPVCGIMPFRRPRQPPPAESPSGAISPTLWAINVRCLEDVDLETLPQLMIEGSKL